MDKLKLSIIIPCYNVEKYIDKCLDSIYDQNINNYEIIVIDDFSTDNTLKKLKTHQLNHSNINIIENKSNKGAGYSRNIAIKKCKGEFVSFVDSDDYLEKNYYNLLFEKLEKERADIVVTNIYLKYTEITGMDTLISACEGQINKKNIINNGLAASPCNKIIKTELLKNNLFAEGIINEDIVSIIPAIIESKKTTYQNLTYYNYVQRKNSVQNESLSEKKFDIFKAFKILSNRLKKTSNSDELMDSLVFNQLILFLLYIIPKEKSFIKRYKYLKLYAKEIKCYSIQKNIEFIIFLNTQSKMHKIYYKIIIVLITLNLIFLTDLLMMAYKFYKNYFTKKVIPLLIDDKSLIMMAKKQQRIKTTAKVSVIVPNYNYEKFLYQRIYSILYQKKKIKELIILDDCSRDNSIEMIKHIKKLIEPYIDVKTSYNDMNSGSAFIQWKKGILSATGQYVWIAEADDYSSKNFLKEQLKSIKKVPNVVLSYTDTAFIDVNGKMIYKSVKNDIDLMRTGHWDKNFVNDGLKEIKNFAYLNCTIANVSSIIFKNGNFDEVFKLMDEYKQAGDWLFYLELMSRGKICFINKNLNYYRAHGKNVTTTNKKQLHFDEIKKIHQYLDNKYKFNTNQKKEILKRYVFLEEKWQIKR